jgi:uncharacterized protein (UPF0332 family)
VKPETREALARRGKALAKANRILESGMPDVAARPAYIASLTAARGLIYEMRGRAPKTHTGVKSVVHELVREGLNLDRRLLDILEYGFELKVTADYGDPDQISEPEAKRAIDLAAEFIAATDNILARNT